MPGYVRGIKEYGVFVELAPNLTGLAEWVDGLTENARVSVYIKAILPDRRKIKLNILSALEPEAAPPLSYFQTSGQLHEWSYAPIRL